LAGNLEFWREIFRPGKFEFSETIQIFPVDFRYPPENHQKTDVSELGWLPLQGPSKYSLQNLIGMNATTHNSNKISTIVILDFIEKIFGGKFEYLAP
jgi:hypothetical protein